MKPLFHNILGLATAGLSGLAGCASGDTFLRADTGAIEIAAVDVNKHEIIIEASSSWMVDTQGGVEWLNLEYDKNIQNLLRVQAADRNESLEDRTGEITVISGDGLNLVIPVVQRAMDVEFDVTPSEFEPFDAQNNSTRTLTVSISPGDLEWSFLVLDTSDWIVVGRGTEADGTENTLAIDVKNTREFDERRDTIVVRPVNDAFWKFADSIAVVQKGIDLVVDSDMMDQETFEIDVPAEGGEVSLSVISRASWELTTDASPERVSLSITEGEADEEYGVSIVMDVAPNDSAEEYTFTLTFESAGEIYQYICRQRGNQPESEEET